MVDDKLVDGNSNNVETQVSNKGGWIEAHAKTSERFSFEELKDDDR